MHGRTRGSRLNFRDDISTIGNRTSKGFSRFLKRVADNMHISAIGITNWLAIILRQIPQFSSIETCTVGLYESGFGLTINFKKAIQTFFYLFNKTGFLQVCRPYRCNRSLWYDPNVYKFDWRRPYYDLPVLTCRWTPNKQNLIRNDEKHEA